MIYSIWKKVLTSKRTTLVEYRLILVFWLTDHQLVNDFWTGRYWIWLPTKQRFLEGPILWLTNLQSEGFGPWVLPGRQVLLMLHVLSLMRTKRFFTIKFVALYTMVLLVDAQRDEADHTCLLALIGRWKCHCIHAEFSLEEMVRVETVMILHTECLSQPRTEVCCPKFGLVIIYLSAPTVRSWWNQWVFINFYGSILLYQVIDWRYWELLRLQRVFPTNQTIPPGNSNMFRIWISEIVNNAGSSRAKQRKCRRPLGILWIVTSLWSASTWQCWDY